jgi:hypothetical protein
MAETSATYNSCSDLGIFLISSLSQLETWQ